MYSSLQRPYSVAKPSRLGAGLVPLLEVHARLGLGNAPVGRMVLGFAAEELNRGRQPWTRRGREAGPGGLSR